MQYQEAMKQLIIDIEDTSIIPSLKRILGALKGVSVSPVSKKKNATMKNKKIKELKDFQERIKDVSDLDDETIRQECEIVRKKLYEERLSYGEIKEIIYI